MDDPLSALDAHVGKDLFRKCIRGALREKAVLLVTHQLQFVNQADHVIVMSQGKIAERGDAGAISAVAARLEDADWTVREGAVLALEGLTEEATGAIVASTSGLDRIFVFTSTCLTI